MSKFLEDGFYWVDEEVYFVFDGVNSLYDDEKQNYAIIHVNEMTDESAHPSIITLNGEENLIGAKAEANRVLDACPLIGEQANSNDPKKVMQYFRARFRKVMM
ncbi:hypothetical protein LCGC14_1709680, partial [marine sediment metagenome]